MFSQIHDTQQALSGQKHWQNLIIASAAEQSSRDVAANKDVIYHTSRLLILRGWALLGLRPNILTIRLTANNEQHTGIGN